MLCTGITLTIAFTSMIAAINVIAPHHGKLRFIPRDGTDAANFITPVVTTTPGSVVYQLISSISSIKERIILALEIPSRRYTVNSSIRDDALERIV